MQKQSLKDKAKTAREIELMISSARNEYRKGKLDSTVLAELKRLQDEKWVRFEDAQQEIDEQEKQFIKTTQKNTERWTETTEMLNKEIDGLQKDRDEWKQKLQQLLSQWDNQGHLGVTIQETDWLLGEFGRLRKLLK